MGRRKKRGKEEREKDKKRRGGKKKVMSLKEDCNTNQPNVQPLLYDLTCIRVFSKKREREFKDFGEFERTVYNSNIGKFLILSVSRHKDCPLWSLIYFCLSICRDNVKKFVETKIWIFVCPITTKSIIPFQCTIFRKRVCNFLGVLYRTTSS